MILILLLSFTASIAALNCSAGMNSTSNQVTKTIPTTWPRFLSIVGSFFNSSWYSFPGNLTVGADNQIGSIRTFVNVMETGVFSETLLRYELNDSFFKQAWQGPGDNGASISFGNFSLGSYEEYLSG